MCTNFRIESKIDKLINLLTYPNIKGEMKSTFCFKNSVGISDEWDAFLCLIFSFPFLCQ